MYKVDRGVRIGFSQEDGEENGEETACVKGPMGKSLAYVRKKTQIRHDAVSQGVGKANGRVEREAHGLAWVQVWRPT